MSTHRVLAAALLLAVTELVSSAKTRAINSSSSGNVRPDVQSRLTGLAAITPMNSLSERYSRVIKATGMKVE